MFMRESNGEFIGFKELLLPVDMRLRTSSHSNYVRDPFGISDDAGR